MINLKLNSVERDQICTVWTLFKQSYLKIRILLSVKLNLNNRRRCRNKEMKNEDNRRLHGKSCCLFKLVLKAE